MFILLSANYANFRKFLFTQLGEYNSFNPCNSRMKEKILADIRNNLLVAFNCVKQNFDDNVIIRITSLPAELIQKIRKIHEQYREKADGLLKKEFGIEF